MDRYTPKYIATHCIDFYFRCGNTPIHILTYGNEVPETLNDIVRTRHLQQIVAQIHGYTFVDSLRNGSLRINDDYTNEINDLFTEYIHENPERESIQPEFFDVIRMFAPNASIGFYSYDFHGMVNGQSEYILVASPAEGVAVDTNLMNCLPSLEGCELSDDMKILRF